MGGGGSKPQADMDWAQDLQDLARKDIPNNIDEMRTVLQRWKKCGQQILNERQRYQAYFEKRDGIIALEDSIREEEDKLREKDEQIQEMEQKLGKNDERIQEMERKLREKEQKLRRESTKTEGLNGLLLRQMWIVQQAHNNLYRRLDAQHEYEIAEIVRAKGES